MDKKENIQNNEEKVSMNLFSLASEELKNETKETTEDNQSLSFENLFQNSEDLSNDISEEATNEQVEETPEIEAPKEEQPSDIFLNTSEQTTQPEETPEIEAPKEEQPSDIFLNTNEQATQPEETPVIEAPKEEQPSDIFLNTNEQATQPEKTSDTEAPKEEQPSDIFLNTNEQATQPEKAPEPEVKEEPKPSTNPFFEGETILPTANDKGIENNPIFLNKIELNESNKHVNNKKINLDNVPHYNVKIEKKKPKKLKFVVGVLSYATFICLLLIGITLLIYVGNIKLKEMKGDFTPPKYNAYVVLTGSMLPKIKVEDVVLTKKTDPAELKEGDIITFASSDERYAGTIITHRIIKKYYDSTTGKYTFQSKGDNNNVADNALVEEANIFGRVILKIPKLGYLQIFLASKGGWILVILIPCAVVISFDIMKLIKMIGQKRKLKIVK